MESLYITAILLASVSFLLHTVTAQYGIYYDSRLNSMMYYRSLVCYGNDLYGKPDYDPRMSLYTERNNNNCCYLAGSRNKCCQKTSFSTATRTFTKVCKCDPDVLSCGPPPDIKVTTTPPPPNPQPQPSTAPSGFGVYYDYNLNAWKYYQPLRCPRNNLYGLPSYDATIASYTIRNDDNCCYLATSRNDCCVETTFSFVTRKFVTTCKCDPVQTCPANAVTPPPTTTTTEPPPFLYCPVVTTRILNSEPVTDNCGAYPGVFRIVRSNTGRTVCNVVLADAMVQGTRKKTLVTSKLCANTADNVNNDVAAIAVTPSLHLAYSQFNKIEGDDGAVFLDPNAGLLNFLTSHCQVTACGLRMPDMTGRVDYEDCHVLSYGAHDASTLTQDGLRTIPVRIDPMACHNVTILLASNTMCFTSRDLVPVMCANDFGAPVFCKLPKTGENIVVGVTAGTNRCGEAVSFGVVRWPAF